MNYLDFNGLTHLKEIIMSHISSKIEKNQGAENVNKVLSIDSNGDISPSDFHIPAITSDDNGKILQVVNGDLAYVSIDIKTVYSGTTEPSDDVGEDGDIYLQL